MIIVIRIHSLTFIAGLLLQYSSFPSTEHTHILQLSSFGWKFVWTRLVSVSISPSSSSVPSSSYKLLSATDSIFKIVLPGTHLRFNASSSSGVFGLILLYKKSTIIHYLFRFNNWLIGRNSLLFHWIERLSLATFG